MAMQGMHEMATVESISGDNEVHGISKPKVEEQGSNLNFGTHLRGGESSTTPTQENALARGTFFGVQDAGLTGSTKLEGCPNIVWVNFRAFGKGEVELRNSKP